MLLRLVCSAALAASPGSRYTSASDAQRDAAQPAADARRLLDTVSALAAAAKGVVSVTTVDVATGTTISYHGSAPVFMSSVVKLPLAVQLLARVDRGELRLSDTIALAPKDLRVGNGGLATEYPRGVVLTVDQLLARAISRSDNTASDALMRYSGGPGVVMRELRRLGVTGIRIDRFYAENTWSYNGITSPPAQALWTPALIDSETEAASAVTREHGAATFLADPRDRATTSGIAVLLRRLWARELLSPVSFARLSHLMFETQNPPTRLVAGAPAGVRVAHKTGTWGVNHSPTIAVNDVGVLVLPSGRMIVLAVMIGGSRAPVATQEAAIQNITRAVTDYWTNRGSPGGRPR